MPNLIAEDQSFRAAKVLIGRGGQNMRRISEVTNAKLRVRGRGSGHLEGPDARESTDQLMCCISCPDREGYELAKSQALAVFEQMFDSYREHCRKSGRPAPILSTDVHE